MLMSPEDLLYSSCTHFNLTQEVVCVTETKRGYPHVGLADNTACIQPVCGAKLSTARGRSPPPNGLRLGRFDAREDGACRSFTSIHL